MNPFVVTPAKAGVQFRTSWIPAFAGMTAFGVIVLVSVFGFAKTAPLADKVWVIVRPVQCLDNPWEKDWLAKHHHQASKYPRRKESELIKSFFAKKNIQILEIRMKPYVNGTPLCQTCNCSRGDVLYFLMNAQFAGKMVDMGYTERIPADEVPQKKKK